MLHHEIAKKHGWVRIKPVTEGWSGEEKFHAWGADGKEYLLRIADEKAEKAMRLGFEGLQKLQDLPVPETIEIGRAEEKVYSIFSWIEGVPLENALPQLDERTQYALGVTAGRVLSQMHKLPASPDRPEWGEFFRRKIERKLKMYADCPLKYDRDENQLRVLQENQHFLDDRPQTFQHGDFHVGNMVFSPAGRLGIIDFNRADEGDPWEEFNRIVWCVQASPSFASGQIYGYFNGNVPEEFWYLLRLYIANNSLGSLPWAIAFGDQEIETMRRQQEEILEWYDDFRLIVPRWYRKPDFARDRSSLQCKIFPAGSQKDYVFTVVLSRCGDKWMLSRHRKRQTWETQGGHIENGETPEACARRELFEESGAKYRSLRHVFDYVGWDEFDYAAGAVFYAEIEDISALPDSEMAEVRLFDELPSEITYPCVTPKLFRYLEENFLQD